MGGSVRRTWLTPIEESGIFSALRSPVTDRTEDGHTGGLAVGSALTATSRRGGVIWRPAQLRHIQGPHDPRPPNPLSHGSLLAACWRVGADHAAGGGGARSEWDLPESRQDARIEFQGRTGSDKTGWTHGQCRDMLPDHASSRADRYAMNCVSGTMVGILLLLYIASPLGGNHVWASFHRHRYSWNWCRQIA